MLSAEEWRKREKVDSRRWFLIWWLTFPLIFMPLLLIFGWATGDPLFPDTIARALTYSFMFPFMYTIAELYHSRKAFSRGVHTGLFEHGLLIRGFGLSRADFIPYALIGNIHLKEGRFGKALMMDIVGFRKPTRAYRDRVLGEDGLAMLRRMIMRRPEEEEEPPELHVYGGRASKLRSIPRTSEESGTGTGTNND